MYRHKRTSLPWKKKVLARPSKMNIILGDEFPVSKSDRRAGSRTRGRFDTSRVRWGNYQIMQKLKKAHRRQEDICSRLSFLYAPLVSLIALPFRMGVCYILGYLASRHVVCRSGYPQEIGCSGTMAHSGQYIAKETKYEI